MENDTLIKTELGISAGIIIGTIILVALLAPNTVNPTLEQSKRVGETPRSYINRWHDSEMKVTCWLFSQGMDCIPDKDINANQ